MSRRIRVSVLVPALDEEAALPEALASAADADEVVVADGGSADASRAVARRAGALVVDAPRGRGRQLATAAAWAGGDVFLVLHADARLPAEAVAAVRAAVASGAHWGAFAVRHVPPPSAGAFARWLLARADARSRRRPLPYGDQAPWCTRDAWEAVGGVPDWPLMEDWELSRRLRARFGPPRRLAGEVAASGRRAAARPLRTALAWSSFPTLLRLGVPPERLARWYRR